MTSRTELITDPFPKLEGHDRNLAYAALIGALASEVRPEVYVDCLQRARAAVKQMRDERPVDVVLVPLVGKTGAR